MQTQNLLQSNSLYGWEHSAQAGHMYDTTQIETLN